MRTNVAIAIALLVGAASVGSAAATSRQRTTRHHTTRHHTTKRHVTTKPHPTTTIKGASGEPILYVESVGGFVAPSAIFNRVPSVVVDASGRVITQGPQIMIFPGPALPSIQARSISADALRALRAAAVDAGLADAGFDWGLPPTADVPATVITYRTETGAVVRSDIASFGVGDDRVATAQAQRRRKVHALLDALTGASAPYTGKETPYPITAFAIRSTRADIAASATAPDPKPNRLAWPLTTVRLSAATTCAEVRGADATTLRASLAAATQITQWTEGSALWDVSIRPILPGDPGCGPR